MFEFDEVDGVKFNDIKLSYPLLASLFAFPQVEGDLHLLPIIDDDACHSPSLSEVLLQPQSSYVRRSRQL